MARQLYREGIPGRNIALKNPHREGSDTRTARRGAVELDQSLRLSGRPPHGPLSRFNGRINISHL